MLAVMGFAKSSTHPTASCDDGGLIDHVKTDPNTASLEYGAMIPAHPMIRRRNNSQCA
jgi:hypothetical protein